MKPSAISIAAVAFLLAGCIYEEPLVAEHTLPIDPAILGLWEPVPKKQEAPDKEKGHPLLKIFEHPKEDSRLLILKFSETEYTVDDGMIRYRAYPIGLGGMRCVQLQVIGTNEGPADWDGKTPTPFLVLSHETKDGKLLVRMLNEDLVGDGLKTTEALQEAFLKYKDNPDLFGDPGEYRKVEGE